MLALGDTSYPLYFKRVEDQIDFAAASKQLGFDTELPNAESEVPSVIVSRVQAITQHEIVATTTALTNLASQFRGTYDGWETRAMAN